MDTPTSSPLDNLKIRFLTEEDALRFQASYAAGNPDYSIPVYPFIEQDGKGMRNPAWSTAPFEYVIYQTKAQHRKHPIPGAMVGLP